MKARIAAALAATLVACAAAQEKPAVAPTASGDVPPELAGFGWFAELRGACWRGEHSDGKTYDVQCYLAQYERLLRGSIKIHRGGAATPSFEGDAVFAVDAAGEKKVTFTQWGTGGTYSTGEITFDGDALVFRNRLPDGKFADVRSIWRKTPEGYTVVREREVKDKGWDPILEVKYRRQG
jgi:hypothetical protein